MKIRYKVKEIQNIWAVGNILVYGFRNGYEADVSNIFKVEKIIANRVYLRHSTGDVKKYLEVSDPVWKGGAWRYASAAEAQKFRDRFIGRENSL